MIIKTPKGTEIKLVVESNAVVAYNGSNLLGIVKAQANKALGWHLVAGDAAIAVSTKDQKAVKDLIASTAAPLSQGIQDMIDHQNHVDMINRVSARGF